MSHFGSLVKSLASLSVPVKMQQEIPVKSCAQASAVPVLGEVPVCCAPKMPVEHRILHEQPGEAVAKHCTLCHQSTELL